MLLPFFLANAMLAALSRLGLGPDTALLAAEGIFLGGADLLHMEEIEELGSGTASIGGAGTFDGIVLSGLVATLLA